MPDCKPKTAPLKPKIIFIAGPTASGKSALSIRLAKRLNAEIISMDSMQLYKGLDIVSSKPSLAMQRRIPHHLIDIVSPDEEFDVNSYRKLALKKIREIHKKGKIPIFCGGTGLYMSIVVNGIFEDIKKDEGLRQELYALAKRKGNIFLHNKLKSIDEAAAVRIHPNDLRRVVRALEVYKISGRPISELWNKRKGLGGKYDIRAFCLNKDRKSLYKDIDSRVEKMFARGLVKEVRGLLSNHLSQTCLQAIGIKEVKGCLDGSYGLEHARDLLKKNTRNYAKRQLTWFRKDKRIYWIDVDRVNALKEIIIKTTKG